MLIISRSTKNCNSTMFWSRRSLSGTKSERENSSCIPDKDVHGRNVVMLQFIVLHDMLNITTDISIMLPVVHIVSPIWITHKSRVYMVTECPLADVNECDANNGGCSDNCSNSAGSYSCACRQYADLDPDGRHCTCRPGFIQNDTAVTCIGEQV